MRKKPHKTYMLKNTQNLYMRQNLILTKINGTQAVENMANISYAIFIS